MTTFTAEQIKYLETKINFLDAGDVKQGFNVKGNVLGGIIQTGEQRWNGMTQ